jgi:hypothetical protein
MESASHLWYLSLVGLAWRIVELGHGMRLPATSRRSSTSASERTNICAMEPSRPLRPEELQILAALLNEDVRALALRLINVRVASMDDGAMGSIRFHPDTSERRFSHQLVESRFTDVDGTDVFIAVNVDERGDLYEIDFWKVDFSPLAAYPTPERLFCAVT